MESCIYAIIAPRISAVQVPTSSIAMSSAVSLAPLLEEVAVPSPSCQGLIFKSASSLLKISNENCYFIVRLTVGVGGQLDDIEYSLILVTHFT